MKALEGVQVIDFTQLLPGPTATRLFADFGADVTKIEPPGGEAARRLGPLSGDQGAVFTELNRGKRSVIADLRSERDLARVMALCASADVIIEGFRPGVMQRLGLGFDELTRRNPRLIYVALTGFGQAGEYALRAAHDINYLALTGGLDLIGVADGPPVIPGFQAGDIAGALHAVIGTLLAIIAREKTGRGQFVDISIAHSAASLLAIPRAVLGAGQTPRRGDDLLSGRYACYGLYSTVDGRWLAVGALEPKFWSALCVLLGCEDLIPHQFDEGDQRLAAIARLRTIFCTRTVAEWEELCRGQDVCVTPVLTLAEALHWMGEASTPRLSQTPAAPGLRAPTAGEHTAELFGSGY
jgi:crotonobetainyl-CoA:carnitine CoA-transferase CaiB-like acyl-CoA transferase